jgi:glycosyltransferase involved in cell wall biosynthesis
MTTALLVLALVTCGAMTWLSIAVVREHRSLPRLDAIGLPSGELPKVSVLIPARNEIRHLEEALESVLAQAYSSFEVIAIDDRSTDGTGDLLDRFAAADGRLSVVHVTELPVGWLGKNHALELGASRAVGDYLLFTDADVVMQPTVLARAMQLAVRDGLDHLTLLPEIRVPGVLLRCAMGIFTLFFSLFVRPGKAADPKSRHSLGVGAFNLVRASLYRSVGGFQTIALRPDDDLKLAKILKQSGGRAQVGDAETLIHVEWYHSLRELTDGVMKGIFAALDYRVAAVIGATVFLSATVLWPVVSLFVSSGPVFWLNAAMLAVLSVMGVVIRPRRTVPVWFPLALPIGTLFLVFLIWRSMVLVLVRHGVVWRGTHYDLDQLRMNRM